MPPKLCIVILGVGTLSCTNQLGVGTLSGTNHLRPLRTLTLSCGYTSYVYNAGPLLFKTTAYSMTSLQQSSCSDYYVHGGVNQPFDDHYFTVLVMYLRDNNFKEII